MNQITYPTEIPETLQATIYDWFQFREVVDDDKFEVFFNRVLTRDYPRYTQLLRIEPGISNYDWLVQRYLEAQTRATKDGDTTLTHNVGVADTGTITDVDDTTHTIEDDGTITDANVHGHVITGVEDDERAITVDNGFVGGKTVEIADARKQVTEHETSHTGVIKNKTTGWESKDEKTLQKNNPMSISYSGGVNEPSVDPTASLGGAYASGGALDWSSPTAQGANFGRNVNQSETEEDWNGAKIIDKTTISNESPNVDTQKEYESYVDKNGTAYGESSTRTVDGELTNTETHSGTDTYTRTLDTTRTDTVDGTKTRTLNTNRATTGTEKTDYNTVDLNRTRETGRYDAPAKLLKEASSFIKGTNAWSWLSNQLEVCFMGVYEW